MITSLVRHFVDNITHEKLNAYTFNYNDRSVGLRTPDAPVGVLCSDKGIAQLYAGSNRILLGTNGYSRIMGNYLSIENSQLNLNPSSIEDLKIKEKYINPEVFYNDDYVMVKKAELTNAFVVTNETFVDLNTGRIINAKPLTDFITPISVFLKDEPLESIDIKKAEIYANTLGVQLPNW